MSVRLPRPSTSRKSKKKKKTKTKTTTKREAIGRVRDAVDPVTRDEPVPQRLGHDAVHRAAVEPEVAAIDQGQRQIAELHPLILMRGCAVASIEVAAERARQAGDAGSARDERRQIDRAVGIDEQD